MSAWYSLSPADYARGLRFYADGSDASAAYKDREGKPWSEGEATRYRRQARRLRAMALLCDTSTARTAGQVDFLGMSDPMQSQAQENIAVARAELVRRVDIAL